MNQRRRMLDGLHQIRPDGILEKRCHGPIDLEISRTDGLAVVGVADHDIAQSAFQIREPITEAKTSHHLGGHADLEGLLPGHGVGHSPEPHHEIAQCPIVHVHHSGPGDSARVDIQAVPMVNMIIDRRRKKIVRQPNRMKVSREMEIDLLHGKYLGIATTGRATLEPKAGTQ